MKKIITKTGIAVLITVPLLAFAQTNNLKDLISLILFYLQYAVYLIMGLAVVMFVWNIFKYFIKGSDNAEGKKEAGLYVMWSIIGFFVILSFWGIVYILTNTLRLNSNAPTSFFGSYSTSGSYSSGTNVFNTSGYAGSITNNGAGTVTNSSPATGFLTRTWNGASTAISNIWNTIF